MLILGISAFYHDAAAALIDDGHIIAAAQEERFTRVKHDARFPEHAIRYCLKEGRVGLDAVDVIVFYEKPFLKFERLLETYVAFAPRGFRSFVRAMPLWVDEKLFQKRLLCDALVALGAGDGVAERLLFAEHHQSHAASAFFASPFREAAVLTMDGVGEWATTSLAVGHDHYLAARREVWFPHSLGLLYSAFTYYLGFKVNSGEYKLMGLAPYGEPKYKRLILEHLIDLKTDGSFQLNLDYFDYCTGLTMTNERFHDLFGGPPHPTDAVPGVREMDLAASIQAVLEEAVFGLARAAAAETGLRALCLAGGVALNCVANGKLARSRLFDDLWIQPAAGDAGGAIGAALAAYHQHFGRPRTDRSGDGMTGALLGPAFDDGEIATRLAAAGARFEPLGEEALIDRAAAALAEGQALGWFQGRMEFGPRALGNRSILADARRPDMQRSLNLKVKFRESFRPFAPAVLAEDAAAWFDLDRPSPYMLLVADVRDERRLQPSPDEAARRGLDRLNVARSLIPAVTHVDGSARVQTVDAATNPKFHRLISRFKALTGCPVLVNTSFNVRGEPIVATPEDAFRCFMGSDLDALAVGNCFLNKSAQDMSLRREYWSHLAPD
jgi:carbamoyltransferase